MSRSVPNQTPAVEEPAPTPPGPKPPFEAPQDRDGGGQEVGDLRRGARVHLFGHAARAAHPAMLAITTNLFGAERWGLFVAAQAALQVASRAGLLGHDRALVYWLPREGNAPALATAVLRVGLLSLLFTAGAALWLAGWLAELKGVPAAPWTVMALALAPMTLIELLAYAAASVRRMEVLVVVRDVVSQLLFFVAAWVAYGLGAQATGLAWAFVIAQGLSAVVAFLWCLWLIPKESWGPVGFSPLPPAFASYAREMWWADLAMSLLYRADALVLAAFASPTALGLYGIALQFGNTVRSLRGAFEPVVTAVASGLSSPERVRRLRESLTYATRLVLGFQLLPTAMTIYLGAWLLPLFGEGFGAAYWPAVVLCVGWTLHGSVGLAGPVVMGFGKSRWTLLTAVATLVGLAALLNLLVPWLGPTGAALAVALSFGAQGLAYQVQARRLLGAALFTREIYVTLRAALSASIVSALVYVGIERLELPPVAQLGSFATFTLVLLPSVISTLRRPRPNGADTR